MFSNDNLSPRPHLKPKTIKKKRAQMTYWPEQARWLETAQTLTPMLLHEHIPPVRCVRVVADAAAFQGWLVAPDASTPASLAQTPLVKGDSIILDFGQHLVGRLSFRITLDSGFHDAPVRITCTFAEVPSELTEPTTNIESNISTSWIQDETTTVDELPASIDLPRRYAFRYVKVDVTGMSEAYRIRLDKFICHTVASVPMDISPLLPKGLPAPDRAIAEISLRTLRDCMQTVFEDGPKRDRRLWIGDLRLQALANTVSYRNFDLVKRCLYLFAGVAREDGLVPGCVYERPRPHNGNCQAMDYMAIYGATLAEYVAASGDMATGEELLPVAVRQLDLVLGLRDAKGLYPNDVWWFIDWNEELHKHPAIHGVIIWCIRQVCALADTLGRSNTTRHLEKELSTLCATARTHFVTGHVTPKSDAGQTSWASWAWLTMAQVLTHDEACAAFDALTTMKDAIRPGGPYLMHYVLEALWMLGRQDEALARLRAYWQPMCDAGLDVCPEVWDIEDEKRSPYGSHLLNSYCHAWSCTPIWFFSIFSRKALTAQCQNDV